jgi:hypothetical protein
MKTAVLDSGFVGSSQQTIPLVLEPARKTIRAFTREARTGGTGQARKAKRVVVPFSEVPDALIQVPRPVIWEGLESGFVMVLFASAITLILFAMTAAENL